MAGSTSFAAAAAELREKCGAPAAKCRAAVKASHGDVLKALSALIDAGHVHAEDLQGDVPFEFFTRAWKSHLKREIERKQAVLAKATKVPGDREAREWLREEIRELRDERNDRAAVQLLYEGAVELHRDKGRAKKAAAGKPTNAKQAKTTKLSPPPPFPELKRDEVWWKGRDKLPSWAGFQARGGPYTSQSNSRASTGAVDIQIDGTNPDNDDDALPPTAEQAAAYKHFKANERAITRAVLAAILKAFAAMKKRGYFDFEDEEDVPDIKTSADLKRHIGLGTVHVLDRGKAGQAYIGLELGCTWDEEHGLGVLLHKSRVVEVGSADTSFDVHAAKDDGGKEPRQRAKRKR